MTPFHQPTLWLGSLTKVNRRPSATLGIYSFCLLSLLLMSTTSDGRSARPGTFNKANAPALIDTVVTVRFANPTYDCNTNKLCVDIQFQSNYPSIRMFGMNVRMLYDDSKLEFSNFTGFVGSYGAVAPNPPDKFTGSATYGINYFGFTGAAEFLNGAVQLNNTNATPIFISTTGWTKLFSMCFTVEESWPSMAQTCPPLVWDLEQNPALGSFLPGSEGMLITIWDGPNQISAPIQEGVDQFNWQYVGSGSPPYGQYVQETCLSTDCSPTISCPSSVTIQCGDSTSPSSTGQATASNTNCSGSPTVTYTDAVSDECPLSHVITRTWTATNNCSGEASCTQIINVQGSGLCPLLVTNGNDSGTGSLRQIIGCASPGDTIEFATTMAGEEIEITSTPIVFSKNLVLHSQISPRPTINSSISGLFEISAGNTVEFIQLDIISGTSSTNGAAFSNLGTLKLNEVNIYRNPLLPEANYLIRNYPGSHLFLYGDCFIQPQ